MALTGALGATTDDGAAAATAIMTVCPTAMIATGMAMACRTGMITILTTGTAIDKHQDYG